MSTICAKCIHHRETTDSEDRELWECEAPGDTETSFVTGITRQVTKLCLIRNPTGRCRLFKAGEPPTPETRTANFVYDFLKYFFGSFSCLS